MNARTRNLLNTLASLNEHCPTIGAGMLLNIVTEARAILAQQSRPIEGTELTPHNLAVMFRTNDPNLMHVDTWNAIAKIGGGVAINYGLLCGTRPSYPNQREHFRNVIAELLEAMP